MERRVILGIAVIVVAIGASAALMVLTIDNALNAPLTDAKIGLVINSPDPTPDVQQISDIYEQAASSGIGRSNVYLFWDKVEPVRGEFDWQQSDILMSLNRNNNLQVTLYFSLVNARTLGPFPDWIGNPGLSSIDGEQLATTLDAILTRYHIVDTLVIAGETAEHFRYNEQNIPVYKELFEDVYSRLKLNHPNVQIGNVYALHGVLNKDLEHIVKQLDVGDFVGFTYFPTDSLNEIVKTPEEAVSDLQYGLELAGDKPVMFFETSWSTSDFVGGNADDQRLFISRVFDFYNQNSESVLSLTWYRQYDKPAGTCQFSAQDDGPVSIGSGLGSNSEHVVERLNNYVCASGLIDSDGNPKVGWHEFVKSLR